MTEILYRGAGKSKDVQREIVLKAMTAEERALSVAADSLLAARDIPAQRRAWVQVALCQLVKHWPDLVRRAGK